MLVSGCLLTAYGFAQLPVSGGPFISTSFMPKKADSTGIYPHCVVMGDFNGDGKPDWFVSRGSSSVNSVVTNASTPGTIAWGTQVDLPGTASDEEGAAVGDLDGDGKPDIVVTNGIGANSVSVYRNTSTGGAISFAAKVDFAVVNGPYGVAIGDLDGDGKPDLVVANNGGTQVSFFRNTSVAGTISFATRVDINVGPAPYGVAIGDLDGDGKADLVVSTQGSGAALYALHNTSVTGSISFGTPIGLASGGGFTIAIGDLDGDGKPDIAEAAFSAVVVVRNQSTAGSLVFGAAQNFYNASYTESVAISDLDADGKLDMVCANRFSNNVSAFHNTSPGAGTITFDTHVDYAVDQDPLWVSVGDVDGDGRPDLLVANSSSTNVSLLRNIIGANVAPEVTGFSPTSGARGTTVTITGVNLNGATAVSFGGVPAASFSLNSSTSIAATVASGASGNVSVTTPYGTVTMPGFTFTGPIISGFSPAIGVAGTVVTITGSNFTGATAVTFDGVAATSFTVTSATSITATVGAGASGFVKVTTALGTDSLSGFVFDVPTITAMTPVSGMVGSSVVLTGTNLGATPADNIVYFGAVQAKVTAASATSLTVTVPAGATYQPVSVTTRGLTAYTSQPFHVVFTVANPTITSSSFVVAGQVSGSSESVAVGDLNGDGKPDIVFSSTTENLLTVVPNASSPGRVLFVHPFNLGTGSGPGKVALGDLDGDGKLDIVVVLFNSGNQSMFSVYRNTSTGGSISFAPRVDFATGDGSVDVVLADMNGDGKTDVLVPSGNSGIFSIFLNNSSGPGVISFAPKVDFTALNHSDHLAVADLDNDGRPDLFTANFSGDNISVYMNQSTGGSLVLGSPAYYSLAPGANSTYIATADLDGDGLPDVGVSNFSLNTISLFRNTSTAGNPSLFLTENLTHPPTTLSFADLNGDGKIDLCSGEPATGKFSVFQNTSAGVGLFSFDNNVDFSPGSSDVSTAVADFDGDGKPDILSVNEPLGTMMVWRNRIGDPVVTSVVPDSAMKGQTVTINGNGFTGASAVLFGGLPADSFTVVNATTIQAVVAGGSSGNVTVVTPIGADTLAGFRFIPQIKAGGPVVICRQGSVVLTSSATTGNQWYKNDTALTGDTAASVTATASGVYTVKVTANGITTTADSAVTVTILSGAAPVITFESNNLLSSDSTGNQWMLNGTAIPGATGSVYHPNQTGSYTVQATVDGCPTDVSTPFVFVANGLVNLGNGQYINLYPNPVHNSLNIYWNINSNPILDIVISDFSGRQVRMFSHATNGSVLDVTGIPKGVYDVRIYSEDGSIHSTVKILKL
ncbi:hypothetical protein GCM10011511_46920 [Puia dinghuensis]|uniref:IPT/TIG domain-containing protein n=1 Tax=Puia dinghuensis TaxID=1792502 RepID=A0A8J2UH87_9BACT|nr:hypothetical protein GCM10011511_46920 [Puia dinghuensis]